MVDFRKSFLLAAMTLAIGAGTASAQNCAATTGAPPILRAGGLLELTGSFQLQCTGIAAPTTVNFDVTLGTSATATNGSVVVTSRTGEPMVTVQQGQTFGSATGIVTSTLSNGTQPYNDVRFTGVNVPAGNSTITISGIRINAVAVFASVSGSLPTVYAFTSVSNGILQVTEPTQGLAVATIEPGLGTVSVTQNSTGLSACAETLNLAAGTNFIINIPEQFPTAFKQQTVFGGGVDSETGPLAAGTAPSVFNADPATTGTQFSVTFNGLPSGVTFYVPVTISSYTGPAAPGINSTLAGGVASIVTAAGTTTLNPGVLVSGLNGSYVAVTTGSVVVYNVTTSLPSVTETYQVPLYNTGSVITGSFTTVSVNLAPQASSPVVPEPVASDALAPLFYSAPQSQPLVPGSTGCQTTLLFPFLSNQAGFDTGISIAATGTDPFGTGIGGGTCTLSLYGSPSAGPATAPTLAVPTNGEAHTTVSAIAPNFQGYGIAVCTFTYAHGYAFVSDGFMGAGRGLSEGYVALVVNDRTSYNGSGTASSSVAPPNATPEELSH